MSLFLIFIVILVIIVVTIVVAIFTILIKNIMKVQRKAEIERQQDMVITKDKGNDKGQR